MDKLSKVRAEIERLKEIAEYNLSHSKMDRSAWMQQTAVCTKLLSFIDTMQEEPQVKESAKIQHVNKTCKENGNSLTQEPVSEDLYTVAKEYANNITEKIGYRLQLRRAVCFGANWKEQQLMAKAVDGVLSSTITGPEQVVSANVGYGELGKNGDKVKIIIFKEE